MKLDLTIEGYEERRAYLEQKLSKMDDKLYEEERISKELEYAANYLLFAKDTDRGAKLKNNIYDSNKRMVQKHYKSSSLELELENGEVEFQKPKKNYILSKELKYDDIKKEDKLKHNEVKYYEKLLKYIEDNNIKKINKSKIKDDVVYICDKNTIRFKEPLKNKSIDIDLNSFIYTDEVIEKFIRMSVEYEVDMTTNLGIVRYDFQVALNKSKKIMKEQELKVIECLQLDYDREELKQEIIEGQVVDASVVRNRMNSCIKKIKKYL